MPTVFFWMQRSIKIERQCVKNKNKLFKCIVCTVISVDYYSYYYYCCCSNNNWCLSFKNWPWYVESKFFKCKLCLWTMIIFISRWQCRFCIPVCNNICATKRVSLFYKFGLCVILKIYDLKFNLFNVNCKTSNQNEATSK